VRRMPREAFDALVDGAGARAEAPAPATAEGAEEGEDPNADVIIYGASWCGACRQTAAFLRSRHIPFVERDIERDPGARQAMQQAARGAGINPTGIPVIDFRGQIITGFDRGALERAIERSGTPI
ncbi:MAG: glutaredoxin family protein, partial [Myxococcales bacterium]|nr:glutaredoxin family protein [Myxococcales bacterium]